MEDATKTYVNTFSTRVVAYAGLFADGRWTILGVGR